MNNFKYEILLESIEFFCNCFFCFCMEFLCLLVCLCKEKLLWWMLGTEETEKSKNKEMAANTSKYMEN